MEASFELDEKERRARFLLSRVGGIGFKTFEKILNKFDSISYLLDLNNDKILKALGERLGGLIINFRSKADINSQFEVLQKFGIDFLVYGEKNYPEILSNFSDPPVTIYYKGEYHLEDFKKTIAVVGTRKMSAYGKICTDSIVKDLCEKGFVIVSGMAFGIDRQAHLSALESNSRTIAVLASSAHLATPSGNTDVYNKILSDGNLIISQSHPFDKVNAGSFPIRNKIVAGISNATVVIEADVDSGALITANIAFSESRQVFAVPGNITQSMSKGTNLLIKESKAKLIESADDILIEFGYMMNENNVQKVSYQSKNALEEEIIEALRYSTMDFDNLKKKMNYPTGEILSTISILEIEGVVQRIGLNQLSLLT